MEFFTSQDSLTIFGWSLRAVVGYAFLLFIVLLMGQRSISQLRLLDFVIVMLLGNIMAHPLSDEQLGLKGSFITIFVVASLYILGLFGSLKFPMIRYLFDPSPLPLIKNGDILYRNLRKSRITIDLLLVELRKEKVDDPKKVSLALWEPGGTISIFLLPPYQTPTRNDLHLTPKAFSVSRPIIKEGRIDYHELEELGKDTGWLQQRLKTLYNTGPENILLATLNEQDELKIFLYS